MTAAKKIVETDRLDQLESELNQAKADLATYKSFMHAVRQKGRTDKDLGDALFSVLRRYQKQLKQEASRV